MSNIKQIITNIARTEKHYVIASLMARVHDLQLCEDSFQDALIAALIFWTKNGVPSAPRAWLITTAHRKSLDFLRRGKNFRSKADLIQYQVQLNANENELKWNQTIENTISAIPSPHLLSPNMVDDERLKLIFLCCHPALNKQAQIALSLKIIGGLTTEEIAAAFLTKKVTMAQRLVRAKQKIKVAGIAFKLPDSEHLVMRAEVILSTIYLIYNESYRATNSDSLTKIDLAKEALILCRTICQLAPENAEAKGLLALILLQLARYEARICGDGGFVTLEKQNRDLWDKDQIIEGRDLVITALKMQNIGKFQLLAAINCCHADAPTFEQTDWLQICLLYEQLYKLEPTAINQLNIITSQSLLANTDIALLYNKLIQLELELVDYQPYYATKAELLKRHNKIEDAKIALDKAINLSNNKIEVGYLMKKRADL